MNKIFTTLLLLTGLCATAQVKVGDNPTTISPGAALEIESTNKGLVIPRVANTAAVTNPVNGMMVYDLSSQCFKGYQNGEWSGCGMTQSATASILAQIGAEADSPDIVPSQVSATQLYSLGVTSVVPAYEGAYQDYIDAHPGLFGNPATMAEVQAMINTVNTEVTDILTQIGNEGDNPDVINSVVTIEQLESIGITGITPGNEVAYQEYIDSHPDAFGNPASVAEIQALVTTVNNTVTNVLAQIGAEGDSPDTVNSVVTAAQLQSIGITGVTPANEGAYQDYIDTHPNAFSNPATLAEIQTMVTTVNSSVTGVLAQIGAEGDNPDTVNSVVTATQLQSIGITGVTPGNEVAYQDYIDTHPDAFSNPASLSEIQAMVTSVNTTVTGVLAQIGAEGDNPDTVNSVVTAAQLVSIGITGVTPGNEVAYQDYIDTHPDAFSNPASLSEIQAAVSAVNTSAATSGGTATVSGFVCNTASAGTLTKGTAASGVTQTITATVTTAGTYNITATANGVTFTGTGTFAGTGSQAIVLTASGTPTAAGSNSFTLSTTPGCSFTRSTIDAGSGGTAAVSSWDCTGTLTGVAAVGVPVSGLTKVVTATVGTAGTYSITATANGITFSGSGTFAGTGSQAITLTATGTPTAAGTHSFTINSTPSCSFSVTTKTLNTVDYVIVQRTGAEQSLSAGSNLVFNTKVAGGIPYDTSTGTFTLTAGKTYRLSFGGRLINFNSSGALCNVDWVDATSSTALISNATATFQPVTEISAHDHTSSTDIIYTPASTQTVRLRIGLSGATSVQLSVESVAIVQELGMVKSGSNLVSPDYIMATQSTTTQSIGTTASDIKADIKVSGNIPYNTSTGVFTLTAGKTYHLYSQTRLINFTEPTGNSVGGIYWVDATTNTPLTSGIGVRTFPVNSTSYNSNSVPSTEIIYTPATNQTIKLRGSISPGNADVEKTLVVIYELGTSKTLGTLDYNTSYATTNISIPSGSGTTTLKMDTTLNGNMTHNTSTGAYTLQAGKTYRLNFAGEFANADTTFGYVTAKWVDATTGTALNGALALFLPVSYTGGNHSRSPYLTTIYTPTVTQTVKVIANYSTGASTLLNTSNADRVVIEELGVTAN
ncbi:beta strand repeat-containing protein [Flavobacterium sp. TBRC 19031]|uniref:beta strand repeat-containing protein n=1 Tax=Flavobacterium mekongense TaxID=3379707 RepID=UPI00399C0473